MKLIASYIMAMAAVATDVFVVGATNRRALLSGLASAPADGGGPVVRSVERRDRAVPWVRANTTEGDVVLYENDLPDHYP